MNQNTLDTIIDIIDFLQVAFVFAASVLGYSKIVWASTSKDRWYVRAAKYTLSMLKWFSQKFKRKMQHE